MSTAEYLAFLLDAMPKYSTSAKRAFGCKHVNRTFEAIEGVTLPAHDHFERFVIFVSAVLALCHTGFLRRKVGSPGQGGRANG